MSNPTYFAKNIGPLIDNTNNENKKKLISDNFASFREFSAETQSAILSALPVPDFEINLNYKVIKSPIQHDFATRINNNHDNNIKALLKINELSNFKYNSRREFAKADRFKICARIDAIDDSGNFFLKIKKRKFLHRYSITAGELAFVLCQMKAWNIQICLFVEYDPNELKITRLEFNEAEYQKIEDYLNRFTQVLDENLVGQIPPQSSTHSYQNIEKKIRL